MYLKINEKILCIHTHTYQAPEVFLEGGLEGGGLEGVVVDVQSSLCEKYFRAPICLHKALTSN